MDETNRASWWFGSVGIGRGSYDVEAIGGLLNEIELDFTQEYGNQLCIDPSWKSKGDGEILYPQKMIMYCLERFFSSLKSLAKEGKLTPEIAQYIFRLVDSFHLIVSEVSMQATLDTRFEMFELVRNWVNEGQLKTAEDWDDLYDAFERQHDQWNSERAEKRILEREVVMAQRKRRKIDILRDASSEERERFTSIALKAKRTSDRRIVFADVARRCKREFPSGILGRMVDDKYAKELCRIWEIV